MKLLLCKNIEKLGIVGDVVNVTPGYGRNYLIPRGLATEPTETNMRALAEARRIAEEEQIHERKMLEQLAERLEGVEVTVRAKANEEGVLYGSVAAKEIAAALAEEGQPVNAAMVSLDEPIRRLDNVAVTIKLGENLKSTVKVWVVRERAEGEEDGEESEEGTAGTEAAADDEYSAE